METKFQEGEIVFERTHPGQKLIISNYLDKLYYCKVYEAPHRKPLVYFERDLVSETSLAFPNSKRQLNGSKQSI
jgi:hypothetical protein